MKNAAILIGLIAITMTGCVSKKKYAELEADYERVKAAGPVAEAKKGMTNDRVADLEAQLNDMRMQLEAEQMRTMEMDKMIKAGKLEPPTQEQIRMYELQHPEVMAAMDPHHIEPGQEGTLRGTFDQENFGVRLIVKPIKDAFENYNEKQIKITSAPGRSVVAVNNKELFEQDKADISEIGKRFLDKMILSFESQQPVDFYLAAVTKGDDPEEQALASQRAVNVYNYIKAAKGNPQMPKFVGLADCKDAFGDKSMPCSRIEFVFSSNFDNMMKAVENEVTP